MKTTLKIKMISFLGLLVSLCAVFCAFVMMSAPVKRASADVAQYEDLNDEFDIMGLSIKYIGASGEDGLRIGIKLSRTLYDTIWADSDARMGVLVAPVDKCPGGNLNLFNYKTATAKRTNLISRASGYSHFQVADTYAIGIVYLDGFPEASYNRPIGIRAFIDWDNAGTSATVSHSEMVKLSMADVALALRKDYEGSNTYGTTADQYAKLDSYLLSYNVDFYDDFWDKTATQSVKYGSTFSVPSNPTARAGYTLNGWLPQNSASGYASTVFDMSGDRTVKYSKAFKADYSKTADATTFEKPVMGSGMYELVGPTCEVNNYVLSLKGCRFFNANETVGRTKDFMIQMTFTVVSGNVEYGFLITDDRETGKGRILYKPSNNKFYVYNYTSGTYNGDTWNWYDAFEEKTNGASAMSVGSTYTMTLVYRFSTYTVFIGNTKAISFHDEDELSSWGSTSGKHMYKIVGTGSTKNIGIMSLNGDSATNISDWKYSTDSSVIDTYVSSTISKTLLTDGGLYSFVKTTDTITASTAILRGHYFMKGWTVPTCADFLVQTTFTAVSGAEMSLVITDDKATGKGRIVYKVGGDINFYNYTGGTYRDKTWHWNDAWEGITPSQKINAGTTYTVTYVHKDGYFAVFVGSTRVVRWGDNEVPKAWGSNGGTALRTLDLPGDVNQTWYLGIGSYNKETTFTDWKVSVSPTLLANYSVA